LVFSDPSSSTALDREKQHIQRAGMHLSTMALQTIGKSQKEM
jgi:hypothetical protein